jgi:hypothetical protein
MANERDTFVRASKQNAISDLVSAASAKLISPCLGFSLMENLSNAFNSEGCEADFIKFFNVLIRCVLVMQT